MLKKNRNIRQSCESPKRFICLPTQQESERGSERKCTFYHESFTWLPYWKSVPCILFAYDDDNNFMLFLQGTKCKTKHQGN